jgi:hypothetical protein
MGAFPILENVIEKDNLKKMELYYHMLPCHDNLDGLAIAGKKIYHILFMKLFWHYDGFK